MVNNKKSLTKVSTEVSNYKSTPKVELAAKISAIKYKNPTSKSSEKNTTKSLKRQRPKLVPIGGLQTMKTLQPLK